MPSLDTYRQSQAARNELRVVRNAQPSEAASQVVGETITAIGELGMRIEEGRAKAEAARLEVDAKRAYDQAYRELEADPEASDQLESRIVERSREIRAGLLKQVKSGAVRQVFDQRLNDIETAYVIEGRDLSRRRAVESIKADVIGLIDGLDKTAADMSVPFEDAKNPNRRSVKNEAEAAIALIDGSMRSGFLGADVAAEQKARVQAKVEAADSARIISVIDDALDSGDPMRIAEAKEMFKLNYGRVLPEMREKVEEVLETKSKEARAVTMADDLWGKSGRSYEAAITEAAKITNVDERLEVEARLGQLKAQDDAGQKATQDTVIDEALMAITSGRSVPSSVLQRADGRTREFINDQLYQQRYRAQTMAALSAQEKAAIKEASGISKEYLTSFGSDPRMASIYLEGPATWKEQAPMMYEYYSMMTPQDQAGVVADVNTRRGAGETSTASDKVFADLIQAVPMLQPKDAMGVKYGDARDKDEDAAAEEVAVRASLYRQANAYARETGGAPLTNDQRKVMIARAFREVDPMRYPLPAGTRPFDVMGRVRDSLMIRNDLREVLGREPTQAEIDQYVAEVAQ